MQDLLPFSGPRAQHSRDAHEALPAQRHRPTYLIGHAGSEAIAVSGTLFLRTFGAIGSGRTIALAGLAEQSLARGGAVLWVDADLHPNIGATLRTLAMRYDLPYADTGVDRGDADVVRAFLARGGIGHCVPPKRRPGAGEIRTRVASVLAALAALAGRQTPGPSLLIFNEVAAAFDGRAAGLGALPAQLRSGGHGFVFSDVAVRAEALDVQAHVQQYLLHRTDDAKTRELALSVIAQWPPLPRSRFGWPGHRVARGNAPLLEDLPLLDSGYGIYHAKGCSVLVKAARPMATHTGADLPFVIGRH